jgi:hypothetical protein
VDVAESLSRKAFGERHRAALPEILKNPIFFIAQRLKRLFCFLTVYKKVVEYIGAIN